jgi:Ca2+:H+ antiporter
VPLAGWLLLLGTGIGGLFGLVLAAGLLGCVLAAVHHAERIAHRVGEPFGTLVLALAVTVIEVALIVALMLIGGEGASALARDTVFAAVMLILNGIVGLCLLVGAVRHREQHFGLHGVSASLATLAALVVLTLVLPTYTVSSPGPAYSRAQLVFVAVVSLVLYLVFVFVQTIRHRDYFLPAGGGAQDVEAHAPRPSTRTAWTSALFLLVALGAVVLLAKSLAPVVERAVDAAGAPRAVVGIAVSGLVLLPEGFAAVRAARANRLQTSLNLALGSALATIALTVPVVALVSILAGWHLVLGLDQKSTVLLVLSLIVATLSLGTGRTTVLQGAVHLVLLAVYVFLTVVP